MRLSTKGRYGLKAMVDLTVAYGRGYVSIATLAQQQGISESYLEQLIASLKKAGLVESVRGAQGGYALSRKPEDIDVGEVLRALEGSTSIMGLRGRERRRLRQCLQLQCQAPVAQAAKENRRGTGYDYTRRYGGGL